MTLRLPVAGGVAQLVERLGRIEEARGSIPLTSTLLSPGVAGAVLSVAVRLRAWPEPSCRLRCDYGRGRSRPVGCGAIAGVAGAVRSVAVRLRA